MYFCWMILENHLYFTWHHDFGQRLETLVLQFRLINWDLSKENMERSSITERFWLLYWYWLNSDAHLRSINWHYFAVGCPGIHPNRSIDVNRIEWRHEAGNFFPFSWLFLFELCQGFLGHTAAWVTDWNSGWGTGRIDSWMSPNYGWQAKLTWLQYFDRGLAYKTGRLNPLPTSSIPALLPLAFVSAIRRKDKYTKQIGDAQGR